jgi:hypothetical protein
MPEARLATLFCAAALMPQDQPRRRQRDRPPQDADNTAQFSEVPDHLHLVFTQRGNLLQP